MTYLLVFAVAYITLTFWWYKWKSNKEAKEMVDEFIRKWPNRCIICSYHRFGIFSCYISENEKVDKHYCIEKGEEIG